MMPRSESGECSAPPVFDRYGRYYDLLYSDKPYEAECDAVTAAFHRYARIPVRSVLDVGCGTGGHAVPLAGRGYDVEGVDLSTVMLRDAAAKAERAGVQVRWHAGDMRTLRLPRRFDAVLCLFAALGYLSETTDILRTLTAFHAHLNAGGLLIVDVWNGLAVAREGPSARAKRASDGNIRVIRSVRPEVDFARHVCRNFYHLLVIEGGTVLDEVEEVHDMRFFFPTELAHYLDTSGFDVVRMGGFPQLDRPLDVADWTIGVVATARS
jgi:SAM-dependent methyltransferase